MRHIFGTTLTGLLALTLALPALAQPADPAPTPPGPTGDMIFDQASGTTIAQAMAAAEAARRDHPTLSSTMTAASLFYRICDLGHAPACQALGEMHLTAATGDAVIAGPETPFNAFGAAPEYATAGRLFARACDNDLQTSCSILARLRREGHIAETPAPTDSTAPTVSANPTIIAFSEGDPLGLDQSDAITAAYRNWQGDGRGHFVLCYRGLTPADGYASQNARITAVTRALFAAGAKSVRAIADQQCAQPARAAAPNLEIWPVSPQ